MCSNKCAHFKNQTIVPSPAACKQKEKQFCYIYGCNFSFGEFSFFYEILTNLADVNPQHGNKYKEPHLAPVKYMNEHFS